LDDHQAYGKVYRAQNTLVYIVCLKLLFASFRCKLVFNELRSTNETGIA